MAGKGQKRKDKDRIVLRTGEGQRPNGTYDPGRHGRYVAVEGRAYTRPCRTKNRDVLLCIP